MSPSRNDVILRAERKILMESPSPRTTMELVGKINPESFYAFAFAARHLKSGDTFVAFKTLVRFLRLDVRKEARDASPKDVHTFTEAVTWIIPYAMTGMQSHRLGSNVLIGWITEIAVHLTTSKNWGQHTHEQVLGFLLKSFLGFKQSHIDGQRDELIWLGQRYDLISENWHLFEERGCFDRNFISELESSKVTPLITGVL